MKDKENFLLGLSITLGVILLGLVSYIVYSEYKIQNRTINRCPYQGWSYEHEETFEAGDGCNICVCNDGIVSCTEMNCNPASPENPTEKDDFPGQDCEIGESFNDGCNSCVCTEDGIVCTTQECDPNSTE